MGIVVNGGNEQTERGAAVQVAPGSGKPTIDAIHRDVALANQYRLELIKYLLAIAAALFAFTVAFRPSLVRVELPWAMWLGWLGLGASMIGGMFHMLGWDHYYKSYRDHDWKNANADTGKSIGRKARARINAWRRVAMYFQFGGFIVGVVGVGLFAAANIDNVRKSDKSSNPSSQRYASAVQQPAQSLTIASPNVFGGAAWR